MFEDATFESNGRIHTRSLGWMTATSLLNGSILAALIVIPLMRPQALPREALAFLLSAPPPPIASPRAARPAPRRDSGVQGTLILLPPRMQPRALASAAVGQAPAGPALSLEPGNGFPQEGMNAFGGHAAPAVVEPAAKGPVRLSSSMVTGLLTSKTLPVYPAIAKAAHVEGVVVLAATIAKTGMVENLRVVSGPPMLQQAARDAVKSWRYRPYLLDGMPVEVETSIYVVFRMGQ